MSSPEQIDNQLMSGDGIWPFTIGQIDMGGATNTQDEEPLDGELLPPDIKEIMLSPGEARVVINDQLENGTKPPEIYIKAFLQTCEKSLRKHEEECEGVDSAADTLEGNVEKFINVKQQKVAAGWKQIEETFKLSQANRTTRYEQDCAKASEIEQALVQATDRSNVVETSVKHEEAQQRLVRITAAKNTLLIAKHQWAGVKLEHAKTIAYLQHYNSSKRSSNDGQLYEIDSGPTPTSTELAITDLTDGNPEVNEKVAELAKKKIITALFFVGLTDKDGNDLGTGIERKNSGQVANMTQLDEALEHELQLWQEPEQPEHYESTPRKTQVYEAERRTIQNAYDLMKRCMGENIVHVDDPKLGKAMDDLFKLRQEALDRLYDEVPANFLGEVASDLRLHNHGVEQIQNEYLKGIADLTEQKNSEDQAELERTQELINLEKDALDQATKIMRDLKDAEIKAAGESAKNVRDKISDIRVTMKQVSLWSRRAPDITSIKPFKGSAGDPFGISAVMDEAILTVQQDQSKASLTAFATMFRKIAEGIDALDNGKYPIHNPSTCGEIVELANKQTAQKLSEKINREPAHNDLPSAGPEIPQADRTSKMHALAKTSGQIATNAARVGAKKIRTIIEVKK